MGTKAKKPTGSTGGGVLIKDLLPRKDVKGGGAKVVFGEATDSSPVESPPSIAERKRLHREEHPTSRKKR